MTRKEAREYIIKHCNPHRDTGTQWDDAMECAIKALGEPERKTGRWVGADSQCGIGCPFCGAPVDDFCSSIDYIDLKYEPNLCPNCGADMGQKENDNV